MTYLLLAIAIVAEVAATTCLKLSDGFSKPVTSIATVTLYAVSFYCLSLTLRSLPTGLVYAVWSGVGVVLIGEGDLSQNLGYPRQYEHPAVVAAMTAIRRICKEHDVPCGHPHVEAHNMEQVLGEGYRFLMAAPVRSFAVLEACRKKLGRT